MRDQRDQLNYSGCFHVPDSYARGEEYPVLVIGFKGHPINTFCWDIHENGYVVKFWNGYSRMEDAALAGAIEFVKYLEDRKK